MQCPRCQHENPPAMKFCGECAAPLTSTCPSCGAANPPENRFCGQCAAPLRTTPTAKSPAPESYTPKHLADRILTSKAALEGERKQVTVLFADLKGSMELLADRDPEDARKILDAVLQHMMDAVHHFEGTVNQVMGDGIMALFGAPIAHEDHALRACYAALSLQEAVKGYAEGVWRTEGVRVQTRVGLNSGEVVVRSIGSDLHMDYSAVGRTTHLAARMEQLSAPGAIILTRETLRLVEHHVEVRAMGPQPVKGLETPVEAYELIGTGPTRSRLEAAAGRLTPFVGRELELRVLTERFQRAQAGDGQVVFLVGEAGLGKSRLLLEFRQRVGVEPTWLEGHALSFGQSMPFHPVIDLLKRELGIEESDPEGAIIEKVEQGILRLSADLRPILPYLRSLLALDPGTATVRTMDPQLRRAETFDALRRLLLGAAATRPLVVVFEDLHWMDRATEAFLALAADSISGSRVLCLLTHRPGYVPPFSDRTYHTRLPLPALSTTDALQIAHAALATDQLPEQLRILIVQKAEGNPFFVEEVVKSLRETGAIRREGDRYITARPLNAMVVPDTIQDVLAARIDRMAEASKRTLQLASVIGREFPRRLLERMTDTPQRLQSELQDLKTLELIREKQLVPELVYVFKHALTQDVAYHSLLASRRQAWHRLVGRTIEELYADRLAEQYGILAHHFAQGQDWAKAFEYLLKAAEKAAQAFATREAIALYDQALEAARQIEPKPDLHALLKIRQAKAALLFATSEFAGGQAESAELLTLARCLADRRGEASALVSLGWAKAYSHDFAQALNAAHQAQRIGEEDNASSILAGSHALAGFVYMVTGRLEQGRADMETALTLGRSTQDVTSTSLSLYGTGLLRNWEGNYADAVRVQSEGIAIAREHNLVSPLIRNLFVHGFTLTAMGDYDGALVTLEEGLMLSEKVENALYHYRLLNCLGRLYLELGDLERAAHFNRKSAEGARQRRDPETLANAELNLGDCLLAQGDLAGAQDLLEGVYRLSHDPSTSDWMKWRYSIHLFASLGELWLARGDTAKAREFAERCLELASRTRSRKYEVKCWRLLGEINLAHRQSEQAESFLQRALTLAQAVGHPPELWKTHLALSRLHSEAKRPQQALQAFEAARAALELIKAGVQNPVLRASLERSPLIDQI